MDSETSTTVGRYEVAITMAGGQLHVWELTGRMRHADAIKLGDDAMAQLPHAVSVQVRRLPDIGDQAGLGWELASDGWTPRT
jgi:hypothetical protein